MNFISAGSRRGKVALLGEPHGDVDDHVLLAADVAELTGALQDLVRGDAVTLGRPFGGVGDSGIGREGGTFSREFFTEPKAVVMEV